MKKDLKYLNKQRAALIMQTAVFRIEGRYTTEQLNIRQQRIWQAYDNEVRRRIVEPRSLNIDY